MTIQEFFDKYNNKGIDFDGFYGNQCMDLAEQYNNEIVKAPRLTGNASDVWDHFPNDYYDKIVNTPTNTPQLGDIIIWNRNVGGGFGHIAICENATLENFMSFDQNWPEGSNCHFQPHVYDNVLGWLHPKSFTADEIDSLRKARDNNWNLYQSQVQKNTELTQQINKLQEGCDDLKNKYEAEQKYTGELNAQISQTATLIQHIKDESKDYGVQLIDTQHERDTIKANYNSICSDLGLIRDSDLKAVLGAIESLKTPIEEQVKPLQKHALSLQSVLDDFIYQRVPKSKPIIERIRLLLHL